ncbi:MAG: SPW repeat protein [Armatimonadetes bacterium]|nr:SPW repeat protein [Armatimonadota bacterium]
MAARWVPVVLGLWLILSPFVLGFTGVGRWNNILIGIAITTLGYMSAKQQPTS